MKRKEERLDSDFAVSVLGFELGFRAEGEEGGVEGGEVGETISSWRNGVRI